MLVCSVPLVDLATELARVSERAHVKPSAAVADDDDGDGDMTSKPTSSKAVDVIDLEEMVKRWAVQMFDYTKNKEQTRIPREHLVFNVDWRRVRFVHHDPQFVDQSKPPAPKSQVRSLDVTVKNAIPDGGV